MLLATHRCLGVDVRVLEGEFRHTAYPESTKPNRRLGRPVGQQLRLEGEARAHVAVTKCDD